MKTALALGLSLSYLALASAPARADLVDRCQSAQGGVYFIVLGDRPDPRPATVVAPDGIGRGQANYTYGRPGTRDAGSIVGIAGSVTFANGKTSDFGLDLDDGSGSDHVAAWIDGISAAPAADVFQVDLDCTPSSADLVCAVGGAGTHPTELEIQWTRYNRGASDSVTAYDADGGSLLDWVLDETNDARTHATLSRVVYGDPSPDSWTGTLDAVADDQVAGILLYAPSTGQHALTLPVSCQGQLSAPKQSPVCPRC